MQTTIRLTIAVPTYNRPQKLIRLLQILKAEITEAGVADQVNIFISDNSDNSDAAVLFEKFTRDGVDIVYHKQEKNIGFDGNIRFLYDQAKGDYVWYMSDDDYPVAGAVQRILQTLDTEQPDALLFSFMQPVGSPVRQFNYTEPVHIITDPGTAIRNFLMNKKISVFVLKKLNFDPALQQVHENAIGDGWMFIMQAISVLSRSGSPKLAVISEQLATCDDDFRHIWVPTPFLYQFKIGTHPYAKEKLPLLEAELHEDGYIQCVMFSWALERGVLQLDDVAGLKKFIKKLNWNLPVLFSRPKLLMMMLMMKTGLIPSFLKK